MICIVKFVHQQVQKTVEGARRNQPVRHHPTVLGPGLLADESNVDEDL